MGTTCASFHALWRGSVDDAAKAISRAYTKLGYERVKKPPAEAGKQVILLARASERYVSVFDSTNADLDSGELKDAALAASKLLKTGAVVTSLYDSDSYEFVVFSNGRQVDLLMTDADSYNGPLKRLAGEVARHALEQDFRQRDDRRTDRTGRGAGDGVCRRRGDRVVRADRAPGRPGAAALFRFWRRGRCRPRAAFPQKGDSGPDR